MYMCGPLHAARFRVEASVAGTEVAQLAGLKSHLHVCPTHNVTVISHCIISCTLYLYLHFSNNRYISPHSVNVSLQTEASKVDTVVEQVLNTHYRMCPRRQGVAAECSDGLCQYFTWHLNHHTSHRQGE